MRIFKYLIEITDNVEIEMSLGAKILSFQIQHGKPYIWALVDPCAEKKFRSFRIIGTGHPIAGPLGKFIGTVQMSGGQLVFHLFEKRGN